MSGSAASGHARYRFDAYTARAVYALGEQAGSSRYGSTQGLGLNYSAGTLDLGGAYTRKKTVTGLDRDHLTPGGGYKFAALRATAGHVRKREQVLAAADSVTTYSWAGLQYNWSPIVAFTGAWYRTKLSRGAAPASGERDFYILSATYALSKRSLPYAEIDHARMNGNLIAVGQTRQAGMSAGLNLQF